MMKEFIKNIFERKPAEDSLFLRMLWLAQAFTCFYLIALVDPDISHLNIFGLKLPLLFVYFWTAVTGTFLSYHYRREHVKWLEWLGLLPILISCAWFIENIQRQIYWTGNIDILLPTVHLMGGLFVSHSFELRSRFDFNFSLVLSLILVCFTATLGKGGWFGLGMFVFVALAATLLLLDCEARTFGSVQEREIDGEMSFSGKNKSQKSEKTANLLFPTLSLLALSIVFFLAVPRAESLADQVSAKFYSFIKSTLHKEAIPENHFSRRVRNPFNAGRRHASNEQSSSPADKNKETTESPGKENENSKAENQNGVSKTKNTKPGIQSKGESRPDPFALSSAGSKRDGSKSKTGRKLEKTASKSGQNKSAAKKAGNEHSSARDQGSQVEGDRKESSQSAEGSGSQTSDAGKEGGGSSTSGSAPASRGQQAESKTTASKGETNANTETKESITASKNKASAATSNDALKALLNARDPYENKGKETGASKQNGSKSKNEKKPKSAGAGEKPVPKSAAKEGQPVYTLADEVDSSQEASREDLVIFKVSCNRTVFFRQGAFDRYDGKLWHVSDDLPHGELIKQANGSYGFKEVFPLNLPPGVPAIRLTQKFQIASNLGRKIIIAGNPSEIYYPGPSIDVDTCGNLRGSWVLVKGIEYTVNSDEALYDVKSMRQEGLPSEAEEQRLQKGLGRFLQIPDNQGDETYKLSEKLTGLNDNWFLQAEKICSYLRQNYKYELKKDSRHKSKNLVDRFLFESKSGDCKDFASAFVILCRASGVPARMVVGYTPGDFDPASGKREVKLSNAHAWGEVYVPNSGWVPFDATPTGTMPSRDKEEERYFTSIGQKVENSINAKAQNGTATLEVQVAGKTIVINFWDLLKYVPALIAFLILSGPISLLLKKALARIQLPKPMHPASKVYCKLVKDLRSFGVEINESQTAGEFLDKVSNLVKTGKGSEELTDAVADFVDKYNAVYFGAQGDSKMLEQKRNNIRSLLKR